MKKILILSGTHSLVLAGGFILGIYFLPILTAPKAPEAEILTKAMQTAQYSGEFSRNLGGSDALHWGEGKISVSQDQIAHEGRLSPGPDYKLYLVPEFVENEEEFLAIKSQAKQIAGIKSFKGFIADVPKGVDIDRYSTAVIWCESFSEFITAAKYRD